MPQRAPVPRLARRPTDHRGLADRLQPSPAAYEPSRSHPERVCNPVHQGPYGAQSPIMSEGMTGATSSLIAVVFVPVGVVTRRGSMAKRKTPPERTRQDTR